MSHFDKFSLDQLAEQALQMNLLDDYRALDAFTYLDVNGKRYVYDAWMARTFLLGLLHGASCPRSEGRVLKLTPVTQVAEPVARVSLG